MARIGVTVFHLAICGYPNAFLDSLVRFHFWHGSVHLTKVFRADTEPRIVPVRCHLATTTALRVAKEFTAAHARPSSG